ncbi:MAG: ABC transporter ATP-binding protein [Longibaculum sp.]
MRLEVINCTKKYNDITALNQCSFQLEAGIYALLGPNGSGKSTLMNLIATLISPTEGKILWDGQSIYDNNNFLKLLGYMPQYPCLYDDFTLFEYLNYMGDMKGINKKELNQRILEICKSLELEKVLYQKLQGFSGGMKQRAMLAQALLNEPEILILDEPTAGLDPLKRVEIQNLISKLSRDKIIIFATHVVSDVEFIANEFLILKKGKLIYKASREELCEQIKGYVYEQEVDEKTYQILNNSHQISSIRYENNSLIARIVSEEKQTHTSITPNMTDVYLHIFHEEIENE